MGKGRRSKWQAANHSSRRGHVDEHGQIDVEFDFRRDAKGKDPDQHSPTLRRYHKLLWSKPLPNGTMFDLDDTSRGHYLLHQSDALGEFSLSSDAVVASFRYKQMVNEEPEALAEFMRIGYTIGGMMLWPGNRVGGKMTINGARGFYGRIKDRFDLTLECIRSHYLDEWSPLQPVLERYADYFDLFGDFRGYIDFFLLQDAVTVDCDAVVFSHPFRDFTTPAMPKTMDEYREYWVLTSHRRVFLFAYVPSSTSLPGRMPRPCLSGRTSTSCETASTSNSSSTSCATFEGMDAKARSMREP